MKYLIIPLIRISYLIVIGLTIIPLAFLFEVVIYSVWNFKPNDNWNSFKSHFTKDEYFYEEDKNIDMIFKGERVVYPTLNDYIFNNKTIIKK